MLKKDTGKVDMTINIADTTSMYVVDENTRVFICEHKKTITCYDMK